MCSTSRNATVAAKLTKLSLSGFKSIRSLEEFEPGQLTVLIGANGAGKSNLISFFQVLRNMMSSPTGLQAFVLQTGKRTVGCMMVRTRRAQSGHRWRFRPGMGEATMNSG